MDDGTIYDTVCSPVNLHRFRRAAGTFWALEDPVNVRGVKDLLGHSSFTTTDAHYITKQSRVAGLKLSGIINDYTRGSVRHGR